MIHSGHKFYWTLPLFSSLVWLGMLLGMLLYWIVNTNSVVYQWNDQGQTIAYISDVGASNMKPLFIAGSTITVVTLDLSLIAERWLRHSGRLAPNTSWTEKGLSILSIIAAIAGALGIILLSIFDVAHHQSLHDHLLIVFIVGYVLSAIFTVIEFGILGPKYKQHVTLRFSFYYKLAFIIVEVALAIPFGVLESKVEHVNVAAILEWVIAFVFTGYVFSFMIDLIPGFRNHHMQSHYTNRKSITSPDLNDPEMSPTHHKSGAPTNGQYNAYAQGGASGYRPPPAHF